MSASSAPTTTITARVSREMRAELDALAKSTGHSRNTLVEEAIRSYIDMQRWQIADIEQAIHEAAAGDFASDEEMDALWAKYHATHHTAQQ